MRVSRVTVWAAAMCIIMMLCSFSWPKKDKKKRTRKNRKAKTEVVVTPEEVAMPADTISLTDIVAPVDTVSEIEPIVEEDNVAEESDSVTESLFVTALLQEAFSHLGTRYSYGAGGPSAFDCSGFTSYCFRKMGITLPHSSQGQSKMGEEVEFMDQIKPGDLVFFRGRSVASSINHVGIVTEVEPGGENFSFIHASTSLGVIVSKYSEQYYHLRYVGVRRVITEE